MYRFSITGKSKGIWPPSEVHKINLGGYEMNNGGDLFPFL